MNDVAASLNLPHGYSGGGLDPTKVGIAAGKNNPTMQNVAFAGPLPEGDYFPQLPPVDTRTHGPFVIWLKPADTNKMFGRAGFGMHGDSVVNPGWASDGCIIQARAVREAYAAANDMLRVVARLAA